MYNDAYIFAKEFLIKKLDRQEAEKILESYLLSDKSDQVVSLKELFQRLLSSAQNAHMKARVIRRGIAEFQNLGKVLSDFNPKKVDQEGVDIPEVRVARKKMS